MVYLFVQNRSLDRNDVFYPRVASVVTQTRFVATGDTPFIIKYL